MKKETKPMGQSALAALAICMAASHGAPALANDEVDLQSLQLLREESISEDEFYAAYAKQGPRVMAAGNYSRMGISSGNYSRMGISSGNYSRMGISSSNYSRMGISGGNYSRMGISGSPAFVEEGSGAVMPAPSVVFEEQT